VKNCANLKTSSLNNKAQSLAELATFGAILFLVLAFLIRWGMYYNYAQDVGMRAFRMAMVEAHNNDAPDASGSVVIVEDKHIPDPRDKFGIGDVVSVQGSGNVVMGVTMQGEDGDGLPKTYAQLPQQTYIIGKNSYTYKTAGFRLIHSYAFDPSALLAFFGITLPPNFIKHTTGVWVQLPDEDRKFVAWSQIRCYREGQEPFTDSNGNGKWDSG
jgi:hypothetical protein